MNTRPVVPQENPDSAAHRRQLADRVNASLPHDGSHPMTAPLVLKSYALANLPAAASWTAGLVYVTDETGGAIPAFSDGTNWRRVTDRAICS